MPSFEGQLKTFQIVSLNPSNLNCVLTRDKAIQSIIYRASKSPEAMSKVRRTTPTGISKISVDSHLHSKKENTLTRLTKGTFSRPEGSEVNVAGGNISIRKTFIDNDGFKKPQKIIFKPQTKPR